MIKLIIDKECKECPWRMLRLYDGYDASVVCEHEKVCRFLGDPKGMERIKTAKELIKD